MLYNKKYKLEKIEQHHHYNPIYEGMEGCTCYLAYLNPGERGLLLYVRDDLFDTTPHRLHTSVIQYVAYNDNTITVKTHNTTLTFVEIESAEECNDQIH